MKVNAESCAKRINGKRDCRRKGLARRTSCLSSTITAATPTPCPSLVYPWLIVQHLLSVIAQSLCYYTAFLVFVTEVLMLNSSLHVPSFLRLASLAQMSLISSRILAAWADVL